MTELRWYGKQLDKELTDLQIIVLSDLHYGNQYCSIKHFQRTVDFIRDNNCVCFLNGDLLEAVTKASKGDVYTQNLTPQQQRDDVVSLLEPIKDKILAVTTGNHEQRIYNETGVDLSLDIATALEAPYRAEGMLFKLSMGDYNNRTKDKPFVFWSYITHGYGGARTKSAKAVKAERAGTWIPQCDWVAMSHDHVVNIAPDIDFVPDNRGTVRDGFLSGKITAHRKMLVKTNSFIKWGGYAEMGGFPPSDLSTPVIHLLTPQSPQWKLYPGKPQKAVKVSV